MTSLHERNKRFNIRYRNKGDKNPRRYTLPKGTTRREAEAIARKMQLQIDKRGYWSKAAAPPMDLAELVDEYIEERKRGTVGKPPARPKTLRLIDTVLRNMLIPTCRGRGSAPPGLYTLTEENAALMLDQKRRYGCAPGTLKTYRATMRAFWSRSHRHYPEHVSPTPKLEVHTPPGAIPVTPMYHEADRMIAQLTDRATAVKRSVFMSRFMGVRGFQTEMAWFDFDNNWRDRGPALHIRLGKSERERSESRWVPIAPPLAKMLMEWRMADGRPDDAAPILGGPLPRDFSDTVAQAWRRAGVDEELWKGHPTRVFRKMFQTYLEWDVPERALDFLVGHAPRGTRARHYIDPYSPHRWKKLVEAVNMIPPIGGNHEARAHA